MNTGQPSSDALAEPDARTRELATGLAVVQQRILAACATAGREPSEVHVIVVTKTYPAADVVRLAALGVRDVGESRDQEAGAKHRDVSAAVLPVGADRPPLRWHFIGRLQSNKARHVAGYADVVHSVDRLGLVDALDRGAAASGRRLDCLVQVSLDGDPTRGGTPVPQVPEVADRIAAAPHLGLAGVMAVAPLGVDPRAAFAALREVSERLRQVHPAAVMISAGMSGDLEAAVTEGATHLRVGSAVLGPRPPLG